MSTRPAPAGVAVPIWIAPEVEVLADCRPTVPVPSAVTVTPRFTVGAIVTAPELNEAVPLSVNGVLELNVMAAGLNANGAFIVKALFEIVVVPVQLVPSRIHPGPVNPVAPVLPVVPEAPVALPPVAPVAP